MPISYPNIRCWIYRGTTGVLTISTQRVRDVQFIGYIESYHLPEEVQKELSDYGGYIVNPGIAMCILHHMHAR